LTSSSTESESITAHYNKTASFQEIIPLWQDYFTKLRTSSNFLESAIIDPSNVSFDGEIITLVLSSSTQEQQWAQLKAKLIPFLQEKLNATIPIINIDVQRTQVDVKPYTTQERFKALLEKNPNVLILIKKLNLEPDHS
jgi:DNA polymerase-3 subunit gamma/tau